MMEWAEWVRMLLSGAVGLFVGFAVGFALHAVLVVAGRSDDGHR